VGTSTAGAAKDVSLLNPETDDTAAVVVTTAWSTDSVRPGQSLQLAVIFDIKKGYHINADAAQLQPLAGMQLIPTRVSVKNATEGVTVASPRYPDAHRITVDFTESDLMAFSDRSIVYMALKLAADSTADFLQVDIAVTYQACDAQVCLFPVKRALNARLPLAKAGRQPMAVNAEIFSADPRATALASKQIAFDMFGWQFSLNPQSVWGLSLLLLTAALGGLLLNFTPCVLPLLPIKIMSLSNAAGNPSRCLALGFSSFLGIIAFWMVLGTAIATISGFTATNQLFQYPLFTLVIGVIIAAMALGMFDLFSVKVPDFLYRLHPSQETLNGSFVLGVLAAILSTPCTAPFMGAAAAWAATQDPGTTLGVFAAIGTGMALPYLLLSASPERVSRMPRSGPASIVIKQVMGLFMLAAAAYFVGSALSALVVKPPDPPPKHYWWGVMGFTAGGGLWMAYRTWRIAIHKISRVVFIILGILIFGGSVWGGMHLTDRGPINWIYYTPERLQTAFDQRKSVALIFTAEWCLNCKALEQGVLNSDRIVRLFGSKAVAPVKVDITGHNPSGRAKLKEVGQLTIPLLIVYAPDGREIFRSDFYTAEQIIEAVANAANPMG
jgi:thiol:disulfide interchange protein DsbD